MSLGHGHYINRTPVGAARLALQSGAGLGIMPHTFVGRTPASAADPQVGHSDFVETSKSRARAPGAGQGTRPTNSMRKWEKYVTFGLGNHFTAIKRPRWPSGRPDCNLPPTNLSSSGESDVHVLSAIQAAVIANADFGMM
jgi:hypothetical protein